jgi:hypothetical protein
MKNKFKHLAFLTLLALVFTIGLTFASVELPRLVDALLAKTIDTPDVATGLNELSDYKTDLYLRSTHLRPIGYGCLALILILIVIGFEPVARIPSPRQSEYAILRAEERR